MTRKTLGILVLTPVLFFVIDKTVAHDGGGKNKSAKSTTQQTVGKSPVIGSQAGATELQTLQASGESMENAMEGAKASREVKVKQLKNTIAYYETSEATDHYYQANRLWENDDLLSEGEKAAMKMVHEKLRKVNPEKISARSFSRCPSGYQVTVIADENGKPTTSGYLVFENGCDENVMGVFRYDVANEKIEVLVSEEIGYVEVDEYLELYKAAKG